MATKYPQYIFYTRLAENGDKVLVPQTNQQAGTGRFSQEEGWTAVNSDPIAEGGIPPKREDFNGVAYVLSEWPYWAQQGGLANYSPTFDYEPNNEVFLGTVKYRCVKENGPATTVVSPSAANGGEYWATQDSGEVRWDRAQALTPDQQRQARDNIDVNSRKEVADAITDATDGLVAFDVAQNLTDEQKQQARDNIGAIQEADITEFVSFAKAQNLTAAQQKQARDNIDVPSTADVRSQVDNAVAGLSKLDIASSGHNTDSKGKTFWWCKFSNGFICQGGVVRDGYTWTTLTLPVPFATDFFSVVCSVYGGDGKRSCDVNGCTRTQITLVSGEGGTDPQPWDKSWIAMGF